VALTIDFTIFCGGSLIEDNVVLTAAHCVERATTVTVLAGAHDRTDENEPNQQRRTSRNIIVHPDWSRLRGESDIALIILDDPFDRVDDIVEEIDLVSDGDTPAVGTETVACGWGKDSDGFGGAVDKVNKVSSPIISKEGINGNGDYPSLFSFSTVICTSSEGASGVCNGDSGGPLLVAQPGDDDPYEQVGITSYGGDLCEEGVPNCFTDLAQYRDWIRDNLP